MTATQQQAAATQQQMEQMQAELQWRDEEEQERRTQAAINDAIIKERERTEQIQAAESRGMANAIKATDRGAPPTYFSAPADAKDVRYCRQCGNACRVGDKFCGQCGRKAEEIF